MLKYKVWPKGSKGNQTVGIWFHGLGATMDDFYSVASVLDLPNVTWIFPQAPSIPVTLNQGYVMPAWFDLRDLNRSHLDKVGFEQSLQATLDLLEQFEYDNLWSIGFSMGGVMAQGLAQALPEQVNKLVCLSSYCPFNFSSEHDLTMMIAHGAYDDVLPMGPSLKSFEQLPSRWDRIIKRYPMGHEVLPETIQDVKEYLLS